MDTPTRSTTSTPATPVTPAPAAASTPDTQAAPHTPGASRPVPAKYAHIKGWGADLDHANRPAYPMARMPARLEGVHWHQPEPQPQNVEILKSVERPSMTPLFGTPQPPSGLSGSVRRLAFKYSESDLRHWLLLLAADRVNMIEGVADDLMHARLPNLYAEMGGKAAFTHDRAATVRKLATVTAVAGIGVLLWRQSRRRRYLEE